MSRKDDLARRIAMHERAARQSETEVARLAAELERLEAMPSLDNLADGTIIAMGIGFPRGDKTYTYVAFKAAGKWLVAGQAGKHTGDELMEWANTGPRRLKVLEPVQEIELVEAETVVIVDLDEALLASLASQRVPWYRDPASMEH